MLADAKVQRPRTDNSDLNTNRRMPRRTDAVCLQSLLSVIETVWYYERMKNPSMTQNR